MGIFFKHAGPDQVRS